MKKMEEKLKEVEHDRKVAEEKMLKERKERAEEEKRLKAYKAEVAKKEKRAQEVEEKARRMAREKQGKDELTEKTARELTKRLAEVDFAKNEAMNAVKGNVFHPCTPEQVDTINKNKLMATGYDHCKSESCKSCEPRKKISGELKARIEHVELKGQMRVDEIKKLDKEL